MLLGQILFVSLATGLADLPRASADTITGIGKTVDFIEQQPASRTVATFTDSNTSDTVVRFAATIDWGDGTTTAAVISGGSGSFDVSGTHTYADESGLPVTTKTTLTPFGGVGVTALGAANVAERDILGGSGATFSISPLTLFAGTVATLTESDPSRTVVDLPTTINWGDGTTTAGTISGGSGSFTVTGSHAYAGPGIFPTHTTITVLDPNDPDTDAITLLGSANVGQSAVPGPSSMFLLAVGLSLVVLVAKCGNRWLT